MFERKVSSGAVSARILNYFRYYVRFVGFFWFRIERDPRDDDDDDGSLVARSLLWDKWFCFSLRLVVTTLYLYTELQRIWQINNQYMFTLTAIYTICTLICIIFLLIMQICCGQRVLNLFNDFLRLFRRIGALPGCQDMGFGGKRELTLLIFKLISLAYETPFMLFRSHEGFQVVFLIYVAINSQMITHCCFMGFLSVGALYDRMNRYVRHELRSQLRSLESQPYEGEKWVRRHQLKSAEYRLDQCVAIYDEIQRVSYSFQKLMDLPLGIVLLFLFVGVTLISYLVMFSDFMVIQLWLLLIKMFIDLVVLTMAVHGASASSRVIQRLSLENFYVCDRKTWHMRVSDH